MYFGGQVRQYLWLIVAAFALLATKAGAADWRVAESAHFRVFATLPEKALRDRAELLEDYREMLGTFTTAPAVDGQPKLDIYLIDNISQAAPFGKMNPNIGGYYSATDNAIIAFATTGADGQSTLLHEYAHHFMFASGAVVYPAWYVEGFAEYFATAAFRADRIDFGRADGGRANNLVYLAWLSWNKIVDANYRYRGSEQMAMYYAQSWLLTHYLFRTPDMAERNRKYLAAVAAGQDSLTAFKAEVAPDLEAFGGKLRAYFNGRSMTFSRYKRQPRAPASVTVRVLPAAAQKLLLMMASMEQHGADVKDPAAALVQVRAAVRSFPGDAFAERALAQAELNFGAVGEAGPRLDRLLAATPDDATLLRWRAEAIQAQPDGNSPANIKAIRRLLVRAFKAAPDDWRTMHDYLHSFDLEHAPLTDREMLVMLRAFELAPQVDGLVIDMASVLMQKNDHEKAAKVLSAVAFSPHQSGFTRLARALRDRALAKDTPGYVAQLDRGPPDDPDEKPEQPATDKHGTGKSR